MKPLNFVVVWLHTSCVWKLSSVNAALSCRHMHFISMWLCQPLGIGVINRTSLPKVIWEEGCIVALSHTYAVKSLLVTMACPKFAPKSTPSRGLIPKPHYPPHPWTHPTYDAKWHPDLIRRFSTVHWTDRRADAHTDRQTDISSMGKFDFYRPLCYESDAA